MFTAVGTKPAFLPRVKLMIVSALLALSLVAGFAGTTTQVDAKPPRQPKVQCIYFTQAQFIYFNAIDPGPGGYWDCDFVGG